MSERKAVQHRTKKNQKYGDLVKKVATDTGRSIFTVYAVLRGRMRSRPVEDAIDSYYKALEQPMAAAGTGVAQ
jgi:hypothetical protein